MATADANLVVHESASVSPDARIYPSTRGTRIVIGAHSSIEPFAMIRCVGGRGDVIIGEHCYVNPGCVIYSGNGVTMGNHVLLAPGVMVMPTNHQWERRDVPTREQGFRPSKGGVVIGDDVWVGANAVLLDGARIGRGAIIGAGAVVAGEIPEYEIWGGSPCALLKRRP